MASQLSVYNEACRLLGERRLVALTDDREVRYLLDDAWGANAHDSWLEQADWNFALRAVKISADPSFEAEFGPANAFQHPADMVRPAGIYIDEYFQVPLRDYLDERQYWFTDRVNDLFVQYVSNGTSYGGDLGLWPASFAKYVAAFLAVEVAPVLKNDVDLQSLERQFRMKKRDAESKDGLRAPSRPLPSGNWRNARLAGTRRDRGFLP